MKLFKKRHLVSLTMTLKILSFRELLPKIFSPTRCATLKSLSALSKSIVIYLLLAGSLGRRRCPSAAAAAAPPARSTTALTWSSSTIWPEREEGKTNINLGWIWLPSHVHLNRMSTQVRLDMTVNYQIFYRFRWYSDAELEARRK